MHINKRGQLTIFVIIAIVLLASVLIYLFVFRESSDVSSNIPSELEPVFNYYTECIRQETQEAVSLAGSGGGYVNVENYFPGSEYAPFSSQLNFLGFPVPYWYYISGNGLVKEQVPSKADIEENINNYLVENLDSCNFDSFYRQGFEISLGEPAARISILSNKIEVEVANELVVSKEEVSARKTNYQLEVSSNLGKFYDIALDIYEKQKEEAVFENYAVDVLRLYAPVDGVEISCSGSVWKTGEVASELKSGLGANIASLKFKGNYYKQDEDDKGYYIVDLGRNVDEQVNSIYSPNMPTKIEIAGDGVGSELMIAKPVGIQEGLGVLGFCYSPYHYVYDVSFPVLVQVFNNDEMFQFPVVVVIDNNLPRQGIYSELDLESESLQADVCEDLTQTINVNIYDNKLNKIDGTVNYRCFNQECKLGESEGGIYSGNAPSCLNGQLIVRAEGYSEKSTIFSTNTGKVVDVILDKNYDVSLDLRIDGKTLEELSGTAIVYFEREGDGASTGTSLPENKNVKLSEGSYEVSVYSYGNSEIKIPASNKVECFEVARSGVAGFFGGTKEECVDIKIPETKIDYALRGGGKSKVYLLESQLERGKLKLDIQSLPFPDSLEKLQKNYELFESRGVFVE